MQSCFAASGCMTRLFRYVFTNPLTPVAIGGLYAFTDQRDQEALLPLDEELGREAPAI